MIITDKDIETVIPLIGEQESQEIRDAGSFSDAVSAIAEYGDEQQGDFMPWNTMQDIFRLRPSELTIWAGINGHGKSLALGQVILWQLKQHPAIIASLEMKPEQTLYRMACQYTGCRPSCNAARSAIEGMGSSKLWIYDQLDTVSSTRLLGMVHFAAHKLEVRHVVIDSLAKCGIAEDDYKTQKVFVDRLQWAAKRWGVHIHLVCHMRKPQSEHTETGKMDIKGTGAITDLADNVIVISRNKNKEKAIQKQKMGALITPQDEKYLDQRDCYLTVHKNRHGGEEGSIGLFFDPQSMQYKTKETRQAMLSPF